MTPERYTAPMNRSRRRATILIGIAVVLLLAAAGLFYAFLLAQVPGGLPLGMLLAAVAFGFAGAMIAVVRERLTEIDEEDPDDYRKY